MLDEKLGQPPPLVQSMLLADWIHRDAVTGKYFILGTYNRMASPIFPTPQSALHIYLTIIEAHGVTVLRLRVVDVDDVYGPIHESAHPVDLPDPNRVYEFTCNVGVVFPAPGDYRIQLFAGADMLRELRLTVEPPRLPLRPPVEH
jgi:hypothetical protein